MTTILSGDNGGDDGPYAIVDGAIVGINGANNNAYHVISINTSVKVILEGLTIEGGSAIENRPVLTL